MNEQPDFGTCSKCRGTNLRVRYHSGKWGHQHVCDYYDFHSSSDPHLHVYCDTCHFDWLTSSPSLSGDVAHGVTG